MFTQIGGEPESDFSEPLGMLGDCHKRIHFFLHDLLRLAECESVSLGTTQRTSLERALRYFQESGPRHTSDEEDSLFPRLRAMKDSRLEGAFTKIDELEADHKRAGKVHDAVDLLGKRWLADGTIDREARAQLRLFLLDLSALYEHHLAIEDKEIFPVAAALLSGQDKTQIGREMAKRRGLSADIVRNTLRR